MRCPVRTLPGMRLDRTADQARSDDIPGSVDFPHETNRYQVALPHATGSP